MLRSVLIMLMVVTWVLGINSAGAGQGSKRVKRPGFAGSWYPGDPKELAGQVDHMLGKAAAPIGKQQPWALIVPHAGYRYSGQVAAAGYKTIGRDYFQRVVILAPSHRWPLTGAAVTDVDYFQTPLGNIPVDQQACRGLLANGLVKLEPKAFGPEHSLEMQLPFLQRRLKNFTLVPLLFGHLAKEQYHSLARALLPLMNDPKIPTLLVASSDFTHYGPDYRYVPFDSDVPARLRQRARQAFDPISRLDLQGFLKHLQKTGDTICGRVPVGVLIETLKQSGLSTEVTELAYDTSGNITGDYKNSVTYLAVGLYQQQPAGKPALESASQPASKPASRPAKQINEHELNLQEKKTLLKIARRTLTKFVKSGRKLNLSPGDKHLTDKLKTPAGAFVTFKIAGKLRGCIGYTLPRGPLYQAVVDNAVNAASKDPRFRPVAPDELDNISIEISVLSPIRTITDVNEIEVGKDGLIISRWQGLRTMHGLLLPQVPVKWGWDRDRFLAQTCRKAGLPTDAWSKPGTKIQAFTAQVFGEKELGRND